MVLITEAISSQGLLEEGSAHAETKIVPSISVSERYDSNVFFAPKEFVPGRQSSDFVTTVAPRLDIANKGREVNLNMSAGLAGNAFMNNRDLSFVSTGVAGSANLDGLIGQYIRGAKLQVSDSFQFTPEPPAFLTGGRSEETQDVFSRGIRAVRANTYTNIATIVGSYALSRRISLVGDYSHAMYRVGQIYVQPGGGFPVAFFNTTYQRWSVGPGLRLTRTDSVNFNYQNIVIDFSGQGLEGHVSAHGLAAEYSRVKAHWTAAAIGGVMVLDKTNLALWTGRLAFSADYDPLTKIRLTLSRAVAPTFFLAPAAVISNAAQVAVDYRISKLLTFSGSANYAVNETVPVESVRFVSFTTSGRLAYSVTRSVSASLSYDYNRFEINLPGRDLPLIERHAVMLSISARWY